MEAHLTHLEELHDEAELDAVADNDDEANEDDGDYCTGDIYLIESITEYAVTILRRSYRVMERQSMDRDALHQAILYLTPLCHFVLSKQELLGDVLVLELTGALNLAESKLQSLLSRVDETIRNMYSGKLRVSKLETGLPGRPAEIVDLKQVEALRQFGVKWVTISELAGLDRGTIAKQVKEATLAGTFRDPFVWSDVTEPNLLRAVHRIINRHRRSGADFVQAHLLSEEGIRVTRERVRKAVKDADPIGVFNRLIKAIVRRKYTVAGPHSLQHIDGNHKLVRYKFVIHVGIDGYSHLCVFCVVSTNNRAETMYEAFSRGVALYGYPSRLRCDKGGENILVAEEMIRVQGLNRGSVIAGRSVHNQRIERFNLDLGNKVITSFKELFQTMEQAQELNVINGWELWVLHQVFKPRIQQILNEFVGAHNNHKKRMHKYKTPSQVFLIGLIQRRSQLSDFHIQENNQGDPGDALQQEDIRLYGTDPRGRYRQEHDGVGEISEADAATFMPYERSRRARVGKVQCPLTENQLVQFKTTWSEHEVLKDDGEDGRIIFLDAKAAVQAWINENGGVMDVNFNDDSEDE
ncbi:hypothetical protein HDU79_011166 [Rhizoclosmatium sp. JEL0117]|nr:hypothetical protein HDU79_011166 [Rhizoclosmatium sp. JEL0117]